MLDIWLPLINNIDNQGIEEINIEKEENCFYSCLSYYKYRAQKKNLEIRTMTYNFIRDNRELFSSYFETDINPLSSTERANTPQYVYSLP